MRTLTVTPLHVERGRQMRSIVRHDIVERGYTFEQSVENLSSFLGVDRETVLLGISIVEEVERNGELVTVSS